MRAGSWSTRPARIPSPRARPAARSRWPRSNALERVSIVGNSGSGKTSLARAICDRTGLPHLELDALYHQPNWQPLPVEEFRALVHERCSAPRWVVDGNYRVAIDVVWSRADTVIVLDYPRPVVMRRVVARSVRRALRHEELWNGNREEWRNLLRWDPEQSIVRWAWTQHRKYHTRYSAALHDPRWRHLRFVRFRHPSDADAWLATVRGARSR